MTFRKALLLLAMTFAPLLASGLSHQTSGAEPEMGASFLRINFDGVFVDEYGDPITDIAGYTLFLSEFPRENRVECAEAPADKNDADCYFYRQVIPDPANRQFQFTAPMDGTTTYYVAVAAWNDDGDISKYSAERQITLKPKTPGDPAAPVITDLCGEAFYCFNPDEPGAICDFDFLPDDPSINPDCDAGGNPL